MSRTSPNTVKYFSLSHPDCSELYQIFLFHPDCHEIHQTLVTSFSLFHPDCHELLLTLVTSFSLFHTLSRPSPNTGKSLSLCYPDCHELYQTGRRTSGVYYIQPNAAPYQLPVYCLMMNGTGHTVIQRRLDGLLNFNRYRQLPVWKLMAVCMAWVWTVYGVCQDKDVHVSHCVTIGERRECKDHVSVLLQL